VSLLKRIEQGKGGQARCYPSMGGNGNRPAMVATLVAASRRENEPITAPRTGSYYDTEGRVQNKLLSGWIRTDVSRPRRVRHTASAAL
jgi:hypothetical protein